MADMLRTIPFFRLIAQTQWNSSYLLEGTSNPGSVVSWGNMRLIREIQSSKFPFPSYLLVDDRYTQVKSVHVNIGMKM
jgi:hypothetical protein